MTTPSGKLDNADESKLPLPALFAQGKEVTVGQLHRRLAEEGFDGILYWHGSVFRFIDAEGSRLTVLAERSGLTKQAIGEVVSDLERHGYVERTADPDDRRAKIIRLTDRGIKGQAAAARILGEIEQRWAKHLGRERVAALRQTLAEVIRLEKGQ
ncbi:winged helix DNA-binding protein [Solihabitans fulvus]|uniref:Winged helix DNA-binding protein n=1 Tax=Solihabitans fulvus TaxID=1892852 RepID=A0A5B2XHA5_9PSEU|nr:MarR family transcriptional regulator [Solihabitans fulvus]KAA2262586.1 winged helix DNA-binding protein [Solihabitans fulvus]